MTENPERRHDASSETINYQRSHSVTIRLDSKPSESRQGWNKTYNHKVNFMKPGEGIGGERDWARWSGCWGVFCMMARGHQYRAGGVRAKRVRRASSSRSNFGNK